MTVNWILSVRFVWIKDKEKIPLEKSFAVFALIETHRPRITELGMHLGVSFLPEIKLFSTTFLGLAWKEWIMKVVMTASFWSGIIWGGSCLYLSEGKNKKIFVKW
ncbi:MAG: hypothetical protein ACLRSW_11240 [Christensenellaceae bacterium]